MADITEPNNNSLQVKLAAYEGPLDLLLDLIKKNEMDIYNIPMAEITQQYLDYLAQMQDLNIDIAGDFLVMAATLIYIKSKMLLPDDGVTEEDEGGQDPREELVRKLLEYQAFREVARELGFLENERSRIFTRQVSDYIFQDLEPEPELEGFTSNFYDLLQAFYKVLKSVARDQFHEVFEQVVTIEEKLTQIKVILQERGGELKFEDLFDGVVSRNELIVTFLAILEIVRQKIARVYQSQMFGEIRLKQVS